MKRTDGGGKSKPKWGTRLYPMVYILRGHPILYSNRERTPRVARMLSFRQHQSISDETPCPHEPERRKAVRSEESRDRHSLPYTGKAIIHYSFALAEECFNNEALLLWQDSP